MLPADSLSKEVRAALLKNAVTRGSTIGVFHRRGVVLLWGEVQTEQIAQAAEEITSRHPGVLKVINDLAVDEYEEDAYDSRLPGTAGPNQEALTKSGFRKGP
jgi:hypothetical protein